MADLKLGTQIGGNLVWHQGILELNPVDDKLFYQDQEIMTTRGYQTLLGTMKFGTANNVYDIESMNNTDPGAGTKRYLRKMRSGNSATIWHETILDNVYTISTGTTDAAPQFVINNGASATFQYPVLTNAAQSSAANSFTRKDFVNAEDAKKVNKAGDGMTGNLDFNLDDQGIRVKFPGGSVANNTGVFGGTGDAAAKDKTNLQIKSWYGVGFSPSITTAGSKVVADKENSIWFNLRNGNMYTMGRLFVNEDKEVYSPVNKPTPGDLGAYTKSEVDEQGFIRVKDERAAMIQPSALADKTFTTYFTNKSDVTTSWVSGFTINGWTSTYAAWSLFSSARSDTDDKRLWFKHGRSEWLPSSRIYHEDDKPTNDELNLVSRAGDVMTGVLDMKVPDTMGHSKYSIKLNNGSIGGINQLVFNDPSDTFSEGILFPKTGKNDQGTSSADYDTLWALDGVLKFNGKRVYHELDKPSNDELNLVSRAGDIMKGDLEIQNAGLTISNGNTKRVAKRLGAQDDAKPLLILFCPKYTTTSQTKRGFVGRVTFERGWTTSTLQANYVDISAVTAYTATDAQIHYASGGTLAKLVYHTHTDGIEYLAMYRQSVSSATIYIDGYVYGVDPIVISDATGLTFTDVESRERIYSSDNKPTNVDLNLVSRAGDTITGNLVVTGNVTAAKVLLSAAQGTEANALTRKDYVDTKVGTAVQSVTATGAVKSTGGVNPVISLINATNAADGAMSAADKAKLDGIPAAAVNKTGDTMTGKLTVPSFVDNNTNIGKDSLTYITLSNANQWVGPVGQSRMVKPDSVSGPTGAKGGYWNILSRRDSGGGYAGIYIPFGNSENKNYIGTNETGTNAPIWAEIYTSLNKPSNADLNLVSRAGDVMTGNLKLPELVLTARESNELTLTNDQKEYPGNTGVSRMIGGVFSQWYTDNLIFGHFRGPSTASAGFKVKLNDKDLMTLAPDRTLTSGALIGDSYVAVVKNGKTLAMEVDTSTKIPYISVDAAYQAIRFENNKDVSLPAGGLNVGSNVKAEGDLFAKDTVNVTGQVSSFADKATGKTAGETGITTARFVAMLTEKGAFKTVYWVSKVSWDYAGNNVITDTGFGNVHLAGCVIEVIGQTGSYTIRVTTPTTHGTALGAVASREYIYTNHGPTYAPGWRRSINSEDVNLSQTGSWAGTIGSIPYIGSNGVMEIAKYIDFHDTNSVADYNVRLENQGDSLWVRTQHGGVQLGAQNTSYAHIYTDRPTFYMNKELQINGARVMFEGSTHGTLTLSNWIRTTGDTGLFCATHGGGIHMSDATWVRVYNGKKFYCSNGEGDAIYTAGGVKAEGNGNFNDVYIRSDERLKSNFKPILNALDKVGYLSGITYDKVGKTTREAGIIAQRLKVVLPEATGTVTSNEIDYLTVSNSGVNALLIEAIKELTERVKYLESKLN